MMTFIGAILTLLAFRLHSVLAAATPRQSAASRSVAVRKLDTPKDGDLKFHETTFIASHNAHATLAVAEGLLEPLGASQDDKIIDQLRNDGVRALLLDIMLNFEEDEPLRLVHGSSLITLDYGGFKTVLGTNLIPFLDENEDAVISLFIETEGDVGEDSATVRATILQQLRDIFSSMTVNGVSLKDMTFKYNHELWKDHEDWPKLDEIRQSGQRIFVFTDRSQFVDTEYGFMHNRQVLQENDWEGIDGCDGRYMWRSNKVSFPSNDYWTRLFFMNHFCCGLAPESKGYTVGQNLIGGGNNGWGSLYPRVQQCISNNDGFKPNFIALDWVSQSKEAQEIRDYLNFGGILGTGQTCTDDSHCATSSCNFVLGVCQCQQCTSERVNVCLGCGSGQHCSSPDGEEMNTCQDKEGSLQSNSPYDTPQPLEPIEAGAPTTTYNSFCGTDLFDTQANCIDAVPCPGGNDQCAYLGLTCFPNIVCGSDKLPTNTQAPSAVPTSSPLLRPTKAPVDFSNQFYCGSNFTDAQDNCFFNKPCPSNSSSICGGGTCYGGISCTAPPSTLPSSSPTSGPTKSPVDASSLLNDMPGSQPKPSQDDGSQGSASRTGEPIDMLSESGVAKSANETLSGKFVRLIMIAFGFMGLLI